MSDEDLAGKPLTAREKVVMEYLCLGMNNKEIAQMLHVSPRTIEDHRATIYKKLKVRNAVELVRLVYKIGEREMDREVIGVALESPADIDLRPGAVNRIVR